MTKTMTGTTQGSRTESRGTTVGKRDTGRHGASALRALRRAGALLASAAACALLLLAAPKDASAQAKIGPQVSFGDDQDFGLGGRAIVNLTDLEGWEAIGSFDLFFPDGDRDYWEFNGNAVYNFQVEPTRTFFPYAGAGINISHTDFSDDPGMERGDTDAGLNLLAGGKFNVPNLTPFVEVRVQVEGGQSVVLTGGLLFP